MHLQFKLNKSINEVFECLSHTESFVEVHPIIYAMKPMIGGGYLVHEKLKVAFMNFKFTYPCKIESNKTSNMITMMAVVKKTVQIHIIFKLSTEDNITIVDEFVTFKSLLPVSLIMEGVFKKQHKKLFQNIENK